MYKLEEKVHIPSERVNGIVKEIDRGKNMYKCTFYTKEDSDKRITKWFRGDELKKYKKPLQIKVKYFVDDIDKIQKIKQGDWIDLRAAETVELKAGEHKLIPLGVGMKLPNGYEANIAPRSSTFKNWGVFMTNSPGTVDNSYSGNDDQWFFSAYATRDTVIERNSRICQFRINRTQPTVQFFEVSELDEVSRGGHGSTGV